MESQIPEGELGETTRRLLELLAEMGRVAVALSAGVDSSLVAAAAFRACGDGALAVTAVSPSLAEGEWELAVDVAKHIGIRHERLDTTEFLDPAYLSNPTNRCYFCKSNLYNHLRTISQRWDITTLVNGANLDDLGDYRPGMQAAAELAVRSPLVEVGFRKPEIRALARWWGLPNWDKPASPCLSSRVAYGIEVTPERLRQIDRAEQIVRKAIKERELRVRFELGGHARIEIPRHRVADLLNSELERQLVQELLSLGFRSVAIDPEGFRSGSLNEHLLANELVPLTPLTVAGRPVPIGVDQLR